MGDETKQLKLASKASGRVLAGVCAGFANYFAINVGMLRILLILSVLLAGVGLGLYILVWLILWVTVGYDN